MCFKEPNTLKLDGADFYLVLEFLYCQIVFFWVLTAKLDG